MIYIDRNRTDQQGNNILPGDDWFAKAEVATANINANQGGHKFDRGIYSADIVRAALEELYHRKCAYCEGRLPEKFDVEHFRPKGRIAENNRHPGYYWLAYTWENLLPSCENCNRRRKDKPIWGDLQYATTGGKYDQFPLVDESNRAMSPGDCLASEDHLMLDPCTDYPEEHIYYLLNGEIIGTDNHGQATIRICNLKRRRLRIAREQIIRDVIYFFRLIQDAKKTWKASEVNRLEEVFNNLFLGDERQFAAAARCVANRPQLFGI